MHMYFKGIKIPHLKITRRKSTAHIYNTILIIQYVNIPWEDNNKISIHTVYL